MKIVVLPYRDAYFWNEYGTAVRDLQIIELLSRNHDVTVINRPVSIYERLLTKPLKSSKVNRLEKRIQFVDSTSFDLFSPLKKRRWTRTCYSNIVKRLTLEFDQLKEPYIFLDFSPFAKIELDSVYAIYWYDLIDNFTKHNRFTVKEKSLVSLKYQELSIGADVVTGVSESAISEIEHRKKYVLPNGVYVDCEEIQPKSKSANTEFDFAFVGFITDKLDVAFLNELAQNFKVAIFGQFFDNSIQRKLSSNIYIGGKFSYENIGRIMSRFSVGLLPYKADKTHDESPLKLYEYFKYGKPCLASLDYEVSSVYYFNYNKHDCNELKNAIKKYLAVSGKDIVKNEIENSWVLENRISDFLISRLNVK